MTEPIEHMTHIDYTHIEVHVAGQLELVPIIPGEDTHTRVASVMFGVPIDQVTPDQRREAKAYNFGKIYGTP